MSPRNLARALVLAAALLLAGAQPQPFSFFTPHGTKTFVSSGTWVVPYGITHVSALVVAGGGGGGQNWGGGGGGGGVIYNASYSVTPGNSITVTVGAGGVYGTNGADSVFGTLDAVGGGAGGSFNRSPLSQDGASGGSGGGACSAGGVDNGYNYGAGTASQGYAGSTVSLFVSGTWDGAYNGGGGGGASAAGSSASNSGGTGGPGYGYRGNYYGGGGGGGGVPPSGSGSVGGPGGAGGGGNGGALGASAQDGSPNTGGGGGGGGSSGAVGGTGGTGIVIITF